MTKAQRRQIERELYNYKANKQVASEYVALHALDGFAVDYSKERVQSSSGNGVENNLISAISKEETAYKWCIVFQKTMDKYRWELKDELMRKKYIEKKGWIKICQDIGIERRTYFYWVDEVLYTAYKWAKELEII